MRLRPRPLFIVALLLTLVGVADAVAPAVAGTRPLRTLLPRAIASSSFSYGRYGFNGLRVRFEHSLICDNGILVANYARAYGVTAIYVQLGGDDVASLVNRNPNTARNLNAMMAVAPVYLVIGDPTWLATPTTVPAEAISAARIAQTYPQLAGVLYDIDPATLTAWNSAQRLSLVQEYVALVKTLATTAGAFGNVLFEADTQFASTHVGLDSRAQTLLQFLDGTSGVGGLMLPVAGSQPSVQIANAMPAVAQITKPFTIVAIASKYAPNSYYLVSPSDVTWRLDALARAVLAVNPNLTSVTMDGWNDLYNGVQAALPQPSVYTGVLAGGREAPPPGSIYLGEYVNAMGLGPTPYQTLEFEESVGRSMAFNLHFYGWKVAFPTQDEREDVTHGRIPLIAWNCSNHGDAAVARGDDDALIAQRAREVRGFGHTVMIRWFWEPNLNDLNNPPRTQCWDPKTDLPDGYFSPEHYIGAWRHIRKVFDEQGATNVIWVWCIANAHGGPSQYYPGDDVVDWVGMDDYDTNDIPLSQMLYIPANEISQFQEKPVMLTETGAHASYQSTFFDGTAAFLARQYPWIRAVGYFDSIGTAQNWVLSGAGLTSFQTFANDPYLSALPPDP